MFIDSTIEFLVSWAWNSDSPILLKSNLAHYKPRKVFAGACFSGILTVDGKLLTFGLGASGQLGHLDNEGNCYGFMYIPKRVDALDDYFIGDVSFGEAHALVIARKKIKSEEDPRGYYLGDQREVFAWGVNAKGQWGFKLGGSSCLPKKIDAFSEYNVIQVSAGKKHSLFVAEKDGVTALYACGDASKGAWGLTKSLSGIFKEPQQVKILEKHRKMNDGTKKANIVAIEAGYLSSFAIIESE